MISKEYNQYGQEMSIPFRPDAATLSGNLTDGISLEETLIGGVFPTESGPMEEGEEVKAG